MSIKRKLSVGIRIDSASPSHVHFALFSNMIPEDQDHEQATRGKAGDLCLTTDEFRPFLIRLLPDAISGDLPLREWLELKEHVGAPFKQFVDGLALAHVADCHHPSALAVVRDLLPLAIFHPYPNDHAVCSGCGATASGDQQLDHDEDCVVLRAEKLLAAQTAF